MDTDLSDMSLWTLVVPKKGIKCEVEQSADRLCYVHVTNVALPPNPPPGPHSLVIKRDGQEICIATLEKGAHPQHTLDFILDSTTEFVTLGPGPTHLIGYLTMSYADDSDDEDGDEDEDEDEDDAAPQAVPIANGNQGKAAQPKPAGTKPAVAPKEAVEGEEDEDEDDEDYPMGSDDLVGEMEEDEGEDDEGEDDDDDDEDEDDEDDEGEEEEGEEEELEPTPPAKPQGKKRAAEGPPSKSPYAPPAAATPAAAAAAGPASKKAKATPAPAVTPAAKPSAAKPGKPGKEAEAGKAGQAKAGKPAQPSTPKSPVAPKNEAEYEAALVSMLKSKPNGSAPLASIGNSVAKPPGVSKMAAFIKARPAMFKLDSTGANVSLVKP